MSRTLRISAALAGALLASTPALAQRDSTIRIDPRWRAYLGCWNTSAGTVPGPDVCLLPTSNPNRVEMVTVIGDSIGTPIVISATGDKVSSTKDGCAGWELARWSADDRRLYTQAEYTCPGGQPQRISGMLAHKGDTFAHIEGVKTRSTTGVRVITFDFVTDSAGLPSAIRSRMPARSTTESWASRVEAGAEVTTADVIEASKEVGAPVTEAWLANRGQKFAVGVRDLRTLRDANIPTSVIDMMIAVSNPELFQVAEGGVPGVRPADELRGGRAGAMGYGYGRGSMYVPGVTWYEGMYFPYFGYGYGYGYGGFGLRNSLYGGGWFNGYGGCYNSWSCGGYGWQGGGGYVIVPQPAMPTRDPGRAVAGRGYSQGGSSGGGRTATPSPSVQGGAWDGGGRASGSSGGSAGGTSGGSSSTGGGERTAKPRP